MRILQNWSKQTPPFLLGQGKQIFISRLPLLVSSPSHCMTFVNSLPVAGLFFNSKDTDCGSDPPKHPSSLAQVLQEQLAVLWTSQSQVRNRTIRLVEITVLHYYSMLGKLPN
jgi:hypothetical protein